MLAGSSRRGVKSRQIWRGNLGRESERALPAMCPGVEKLCAKRTSNTEDNEPEVIKSVERCPVVAGLRA